MEKYVGCMVCSILRSKINCAAAFECTDWKRSIIEPKESTAAIAAAAETQYKIKFEKRWSKIKILRTILHWYEMRVHIWTTVGPLPLFFCVCCISLGASSVVFCGHGPNHRLFIRYPLFIIPYNTHWI